MKFWDIVLLFMFSFWICLSLIQCDPCACLFHIVLFMGETLTNWTNCLFQGYFDMKF